MPYKDPERRRAYDRARRQFAVGRKDPQPRREMRYALPRDRYDEDEIDYVWTTRDFSVPLTPFEKAEIIRRWEREGKTWADLEALSGWNVNRYAKLIPEDRRVRSNYRRQS